MEIQRYFSTFALIHRNLLDFIIDNENDEENYQNLVSSIEESKLKDDKNSLKTFLYILLKISNNHCRTQQFFQKIELILFMFKDEITQYFTNFDIFNFFKSSKRILLFLLDDKILFIDENIAQIMTSSEFYVKKYSHYFFPEIKTFLDEKTISEINQDQCIDDFNELRKIGENEDEICKIIRNDMIDNFIIYVNRNFISLSSKVKTSIFETNAFLLKNQEATLIEYASFYGAIQIVKYLYLNGVSLTSSLWLFAIHSGNPELINLLEENNVMPQDSSYDECLKESIKCHHNEMANYIRDNLMDEKEVSCKFDQNMFAYCFRYHNLCYLPKKFKNSYMFFYACEYDYIDVVDLLLTKSKKQDLNRQIVIIFIYKIQLLI